MNNIKDFVLTALAFAIGTFLGLVAFAATMIVIELFS
jgi:hypothetical protein